VQNREQIKILIAEDDYLVSEEIARIIKHAGYTHIGTASNGISALKMVKEQKPDLILMDIHMPNLDGLAVTRTIKSIPSIADIPIVALSALAMKKDINAALEAGCVGYITKPIRIKQFLEQLDKYTEEGLR
jgi:CheY-like chemotaxis protein